MTDIQALASKIVKKAESLGIDYADVRASLSSSTTFMLHNNKFETPLVQGESFGVGIRVIHKGKQGFYSTNDFKGAEKAIGIALKLAKTNPSKKLVRLASVAPIKDEYSTKVKKPLERVSVDEKVELARNLTNAAKHESIRSVDINYSDVIGDSIFFSTEGARLIRHGGRTITQAYAVAKSGSKLEGTRDRYGGFGFECYNNAVNRFVEKVKLAIDLLDVKLPKAGNFNAVLDSEAAGVFAHEAVGHACEADAILNSDSVLVGKLGKKIGSSAVSITDSPTIDSEWGSYKYDDEGTPAVYNKLIVEGVLKGYMHSRITAAEMNVKPTGSARAQDYSFMPIVRMSNTFFEGGSYSVGELVKEIKNGYLLIGFRGGTVEPLAGDFTFACESAREIKNGELGILLKGCTFGGKILETLHGIIGCSKFNKNMGIGWCGKSGQLVPAGDGACHIGVRNLHIGGAE